MLEAEELSTAIALLLTSTVGLHERIISLQDQLLADRNDVEVTGGSFT